MAKKQRYMETPVRIGMAIDLVVYELKILCIGMLCNRFTNMNGLIIPLTTLEYYKNRYAINAD